MGLMVIGPSKQLERSHRQDTVAVAADVAVQPGVAVVPAAAEQNQLIFDGEADAA